MTFTAVSLADRAATTFGQDADGRTRLHRVFRNLTDKSVLESEVDPSDGRGTRTFGEGEAAIALLLFPLVQMAVDVRGLRRIADCLRAHDTLNGGTPIGRALAAVTTGKAATLVVTLRGLDGLHTAVKIDGEHPEGEAAEILAALAVTRGEPLATWTVPANVLLRPLVQD